MTELTNYEYPVSCFSLAEELPEKPQVTAIKLMIVDIKDLACTVNLLIKEPINKQFLGVFSSLMFSYSLFRKLVNRNLHNLGHDQLLKDLDIIEGIGWETDLMLHEEDINNVLTFNDDLIEALDRVNDALSEIAKVH